MEKIRIITESASDMGTPEREDVTVLPMHITFGEKEYLDGVNLSHQEFYNMLIESDELPKTSLISPGTFADEFEKAEKAGEQVVVIVLSAKLSGTYQSAMVAAADYDNVTVVDSESVAVGERILVDYALRLKDQGKTAAEIAEELETAKKKVHVIALLDTLEYLKKGGRINTTTALAASLLNIKPVMKFGTGKLDVFQKCRGMKKSRKAMIDAMHRELETTFKKEYDAGKVYLMAASSSTAEVTADWISQIRESFPGMDVMCDDLSLGLSCHIGPDGLGIGCSCMPL